MSILGSYVFDHYIPVSEQMLDSVFSLTTWLLATAMVGLGLNVSLKDLRTKAMRPLIAMTITSIVLSMIVYFTV